MINKIGINVKHSGKMHKKPIGHLEYKVKLNLLRELFLVFHYILHISCISTEFSCSLTFVL